MATEILDYQGNAGLGLGSNNLDVAVPNEAGSDALRSMVRDMAILNHNDNVMEYQQKVKDRDNLNRAILQGQVSVGEVDPNDRKKLDEYRNKADEAFKKWGGNWQDHQGWENYQKAITDYKDNAAHAQTRYVSLQNLKAQRAQTTLPERQKEMDSWIKTQESKPFEESIDPYQQNYDFNIKHITDLPQTVTTTRTPDPKKPSETEDFSYSSYPATMLNAQKGWLNDADMAHSINEFQNRFQMYDPQQRAAAIDDINKRLAQRNVELGMQLVGRPLAQGDKEFVAPVKSGFPQGGPMAGQLVIQDPSQDFAAKYALASQPQFYSKTPKIDYKMKEFDLKNRTLDEKIKNDAAKLGLDRLKTNAYVRHMNAATTKLNDNIHSQTDIDNMWNTIKSNVLPQGIDVGTTTTVTKNGQVVSKTRSSSGDRLGAVFTDQLPSNFKLLAGPTLNSKGKIIPGKLEGFTSGDGREYWIPEYKDTNGNKVDFSTKALKDRWEEAKNSGYPNDFNTYVEQRSQKLMEALKGDQIKLILRGKNGSADYSSALQNARLINAEATSPKEEGIYAPIPETSTDNESESTTE